MERRKVCIIGLDGVGFHNLKMLQRSLVLNSVSTIVNKGFVTSFISVPPYTPCAWTSIFTGVNPGKHNVYGFFKVSRDKGFHVSLVSSYDVAYPRIFEILSISGFKSVVINTPLIYPIHGLVGLRNLIVVSDWASPKQFIYPKQYEEKYREYLIEPPHKWAEATNVKSYARTVECFLKKRINFYHELLDKEDYNLFVVVFSELDWIMHRVPEIVTGKRLNLIYKMLSLIDKFIRRACEICDLVILVSDHGFTTSKIFVSVNSILADKGLIAFTYRLNMNKFLHRGKQGIGFYTSGDERVFGYWSSNILRKLFILIKRVIPQHMLGKLESIAPVSMEIDYFRSKAFMLEPSNWGIYVKEGYLDIVKNILSDTKLIKNVLHRKDLFWGPHIREAPNFILVPQDHVFFDARIHVEPVYREYLGEHEPHALIALYGDNVLPSSSVSDKNNVFIYDIAPTVLAYIGLPMPNNSDGRPFAEIFSVDLPSARMQADYLRKFRIMRRVKAV